MVEILEYQLRWPGEFRAIAGELRRALGGLALRIDHIGSTSVPGLAAKDIIDVQVSVPVLSDEIVTALQPLGYVHRPGVVDDHPPPLMTGDPEQWRKLYFREAEGERAVHVHVRVLGRANQRYALLFRDYLRWHPETALAYAQFKRRLAAIADNSATYADTKDPVCDLILFPAERWAAETGWQTGPSDA